MSRIFDEYNHLMRENVVDTEQFIIYYNKLVITNLPTAGSPQIFTTEQIDFITRFLQSRNSNYIVNILTITGYASINGPEAFNLDLSRRRAEEVYTLIESLHLSNVRMRERELAIKAFGELDLPTDNDNSPLSRKVEIRFSQRLNKPIHQSSSEPASTMWQLGTGPEISGFPFVSISDATLTMLPDGTNYSGNPLVNSGSLKSLGFSVSVGLPVEKLVKKFKWFSKINEKLEKLDGFKETALSDFGITANATNAAKKTYITRVVRKYINDELGKLFSVPSGSIDIPDTLEDPIFITHQPYTRNEMRMLSMIGVDGKLALPLLNCGISFTHYLVLTDPPCWFTNFGLVLDIGVPNFDIGELGLKSIILDTFPQP